MRVYPEMTIHVPANRESTLIEEVTSRVAPPWSRQLYSPVGRDVVDGEFFFHRDGDNMPGCTLYIRRRSPGELVVENIVPDLERDQLAIEQYEEILTEFDSIVAQAVENCEGISGVTTSKRTLEDYYSKHAIELLKRFCQTANVGDGGRHPIDQEKWYDFMLYVYCNQENVHGDVLGRLVAGTGLWPEHLARQLASEYNFAIDLLQHGEATGRIIRQPPE